MCGLIIKLFEVPPLAEIRQDKKKKTLQRDSKLQQLLAEHH